ncbi:hypothetical protein P154DRAFT_521770 [Amniculicola lignicola CBS 123094]|uniref:Copper transporter n=1 Tax=Amniculicola lignicola CBS 123094 TaxID=1392246 RepID=A0A6A5WQL6_9PLEO|nr:hypothetical protein P154DRAFT_521770 [Amniculicola lignicola CBS 123094]
MMNHLHGELFTCSALLELGLGVYCWFVALFFYLLWNLYGKLEREVGNMTTQASTNVKTHHTKHSNRSLVRSPRSAGPRVSSAFESNRHLSHQSARASIFSINLMRSSLSTLQIVFVEWLAKPHMQNLHPI